MGAYLRGLPDKKHKNLGLTFKCRIKKTIFTSESKQRKTTMDITNYKFLNILNKLQFKMKFKLKWFQPTCTLIPIFIGLLANNRTPFLPEHHVE